MNGSDSKRIRLSLGLSQKDVGLKLGISNTAVSRQEKSNKVSDTIAEKLFALEKAALADSNSGEVETQHSSPRVTSSSWEIPREEIPVSKPHLMSLLGELLETSTEEAEYLFDLAVGTGPDMTQGHVEAAILGLAVVAKHFQPVADRGKVIDFSLEQEFEGHDGQLLPHGVPAEILTDRLIYSPNGSRADLVEYNEYDIPDHQNTAMILVSNLLMRILGRI